MRILVFQSGGIGDVVIAAGAGAEGLKKKYPNSHLTWSTDVRESIDFLHNNPYIDEVLKWDSVSAEGQYESYSADVKKFLFWWLKENNNILDGFLEDLEVTGLVESRDKVYLNDNNRQAARQFMQPYFDIKQQRKTPIVAIYDNTVTKWKSDNINRLIELLSKDCIVIKVGCYLNQSYIDMAAILEMCDLLVTREGSMAHIAAAVGTQTVTLRTVYDPSLTMVAATQNQFIQDENKKHIIVHPENWCNDYWLCMTRERSKSALNKPKHASDKFAPYMYKSCPYYKETCIHEISADRVYNTTMEALKNRGLL